MTKQRWRMGVAILGLAVAGSWAFATASASPPSTSGQRAAGPPEAVEMAAILALSARLAAETDRMGVGFAQMRVNAAPDVPAEASAKAERR